ncbi:MAG: hypothetical protein ACRC2M_19570, partial [Planktothrix sp.]
MDTNTFLLNEFAGSNAQVQVTLTDQDTDKVRVKLEVVSATTGNIGDLVGFFADFNNFAVSNNFSINPFSATPGPALALDTTPPIETGTGILFLDDSGSTTDQNEKLDNNVNLNGDGETRNYQLGVQIGDGGLGQGDDYRTVEFDLTATGLDVSDFQKVGVRLQSVGVEGNREGSSKLEGDVPTDTSKPSIDVKKYVSVDGGGTWEDADTVT